jgi:ABC-type branched-subunit amino acid transport system ATPase component
MDTRAILEARDVSVTFGGTRALVGTSVNVTSGGIHGIAGANGSGKTTLLNVISRVIHPDSGQVQYQGKNLLALSAHQIALVGIGRAFQTPVLFQRLTVFDNVMIGFQPAVRASAIKDLIRWPSYRRALRTAGDRAIELLRLFGVQEQLWFSPVDKLNLGQQRRVELVRALANQPSLLLLDEPAVGLAGREVNELRELLMRLRDTGMTMLIVEHNVPFLRQVADVITVMDHGAVLAEGDENVFDDDRVAAVYMGSSLGERPEPAADRTR